jgi:cGMP-dependent protein kinase
MITFTISSLNTINPILKVETSDNLMGCCQLKNTKSTHGTSYANESPNIGISSEFSPGTSQQRRSRQLKPDCLDTRKSTPDPIKEFLNGKMIDRALTIHEESMILKTFNSELMFSSLSRASLKSLLKNFSILEFSKEKTVFEAGQEAYFFYIISSGTVEVLGKAQHNEIIKKGGCFGEHALFHGSKRLVTVKTIENCIFLALGREVFKDMVKTVTLKTLRRNHEFLEKIPLFSTLTTKQKESLLTVLVVQKFHPGQRIVKEKELGDLFYIIKKGTVVVSVDGIKKRELGPGDFFGEQALFYKNKRTASVDAVSKISLVSLKSEDFSNLFNSGLESLLYKNSIRIALEKSFDKLDKEQIEALTEATEIVKFKKGEVVINSSDVKGEKIFIVLKGEVAGRRLFHHLQVIGFEDLENPSKRFKKDLQATQPTDLGLLTREKIEKTLGGPLQEVIKKTELLQVMKRVPILRTLPRNSLETLIFSMKTQKYPNKSVIFTQGSPAESFFIVQDGQVEVLIDGKVIRQIARHDFFGERGILFKEARTATVVSKQATCWVLSKEDFLDLIARSQRKKIMKRIALQDDSVKLSDLEIQQFLGKGMFGAVFLAVNPKTKMKYALKVVRKSKIEEFNIWEEVALEKQVLMLIDHPFIVKLVKNFEDYEKIYFLMEYVQGQDLFDLMRLAHINSKEPARFYISNLMLILEHLHERKVIYRDLKPENVMIDENGFCKLIDFGTAKVIQGRTYTVVGTSYYMAPEVIQGVGYGLEADYWSLGVLLFEVMCNSVPFGEGEEDPYRIYTSILRGELIFPNFVNLDDCKGLIEKLLSRNPVFRGTYESIKKHPWFNHVDWELVLSQEVKPPFKPEVRRDSEICPVEIDEFI